MIGTGYNIAPRIIEAANAMDDCAALGRLDAIATGGGLDYICRYLGRERDGERAPVLLLGAAEDAGSPKRLDEKCVVNLQLNEDWSEFIAFIFPNVLAALNFMILFSDSAVQMGEANKANEVNEHELGPYGICVRCGVWPMAVQWTRGKKEALKCKPE